MSTFRAEPATEPEYELSEGILWDDRAARVRWVDIWKGRVLSGALQDGRIEDITSTDLGQTAGAVALAEDGGVVVAAARSLATISVDGAVSFGPDLLGERADTRFNDGSVDPQGRFVVGTLALGAETGDEVLTLKGPTEWVSSVCFTSDGKRLVSSGRDQTSGVWKCSRLPDRSGR